MSLSHQTDEGRVALDVLDSLLEGCQVIGFDWRYLYVNATVQRQAGRTRDELLGRTMMECFPGIEQTAMFRELGRCMEQRAHHRMDNEFSFPDGSSAWFELHFVPVPEGVCVLSVDVTARHHAQAALARTEEQLRHAQKMEAIGRLAGGVAHDFNNLLSVILSYAGLAIESASSEEHRADLREIEKAGRRAADLTRQLLTFSRRQVVARRVLDMNECVQGMESLVRRLVGSDVDVHIAPAAHHGMFRADPGQVEQVIMNLVVNARDAMPEGGRLSISTADVDLDEDYAREHLGATPGPHVMLAVSDTGVGIDKATRERLFEPFFTTKPAGRGTGLGLSIVFGIVQQSGGCIWVYSEPGAGSTFKIYFPRVASHAEAPPAHAPAGRTRDATETILLVEDDEQLRRISSRILTRVGYRVIEAPDPAEALRIAEAGGFDLLLTDVVLPQMNGVRLAEAVLARQPGVKVLYMSGYTGDTLHRGILDGELDFVEKPLTAQGLTEAVRRVLDRD